MNAERQIKVSQVKEISEKLLRSKAMVVAEYAGLTVQELQELRKKLMENGAEINVYKNRLFKIAIKETKLKALEASLFGPNIYVFGMNDEISPAKILANFAKKHEALILKAGIYEGKVIDKKELEAIAILPSLEEAMTILAMSMMSPLKNISIGLNMLVTENKLTSSLETKTEESNHKKEQNTSLEVEQSQEKDKIEEGSNKDQKVEMGTSNEKEKEENNN